MIDVRDDAVVELRRLKQLDYVMVSQSSASSRGALGPRSAEALASLPMLRQLLILGSQDLDDRFFNELAKSSTLRSLTIGQCAPLTAMQVAALARIPSLKRIDVGDLRDSEALVALGNFRSIESLAFTIHFQHSGASSLNLPDTLQSINVLLAGDAAQHQVEIESKLRLAHPQADVKVRAR